MAQPPVRDSIHTALRRPETGMLGLTALIVLLIAGVSDAHWTHYRRANSHAVRPKTCWRPWSSSCGLARCRDRATRIPAHG